MQSRVDKPALDINTSAFFGINQLYASMTSASLSGVSNFQVHARAFYVDTLRNGNNHFHGSKKQN
jgi:hypothetical protein